MLKKYYFLELLFGYDGILTDFPFNFKLPLPGNSIDESLVNLAQEQAKQIKNWNLQQLINLRFNNLQKPYNPNKPDEFPFYTNPVETGLIQAPGTPLDSDFVNLVQSTVKGSNTTNKKPFIDRYQDGWIGQNQESINKGMDTLGNVATAISIGIGGHNMYDGPKGGITQAIDQGWDTVSDTVSQFGPWGQMAGGIMKGVGMLNKVLNAFLGSKGTDNMTTTDAILNSPLGFMGLGLINALGGLNADTITKDTESFAQVGSSYAGTGNAVDDALTKSGKRYGLFSGGARKQANAEIAEATRQQNIMSGIADESVARNTLQSTMTGINNIAQQFNMAGGYQLTNVRAAKYGTKLGRAASIAKKVANKPRNIDDLIKEAKRLNPRFILRLSEEPRGIEFIDEKGNKARGNVYLCNDVRIIDGKEVGVVFPMIQEMENGKLLYFSNPDEAFERAFKNKNLLIFTPEEADKFAKEYKQGWPEMFDRNWEDDDSIIENISSFKQGGVIEEFEFLETPEWEYQEVPEDYISKFQKGGTMNLIPEGALHARKHHLEEINDELKGQITEKGIPVVSESEGGEILLHAEIERDEIIFRIEVTNQIEEARKKYDSDDTKQSEKDLIAIEIGKLLTNEILHNTDDRTNLINQE